MIALWFILEAGPLLAGMIVAAYLSTYYLRPLTIRVAGIATYLATIGLLVQLLPDHEGPGLDTIATIGLAFICVAFNFVSAQLARGISPE